MFNPQVNGGDDFNALCQGTLHVKLPGGSLRFVVRHEIAEALHNSKAFDERNVELSTFLLEIVTLTILSPA